jgi:hypothetical protein
MHRNTSVAEFVFRKRHRTGAKIVRAGLAAVIAFAPVTAAFAQGTQASATTQQRQTDARQPTPGRLTVPITGIVGASSSSTPSSSAVQSVVSASPPLTGSFTIQRFARTTENAVAAVGTLTASFVDPTSAASRTIVTQIAMPLSRSASTPGAQLPVSAATSAQACESLGLVLGGIDIRLLSLPVHLDNVTLDLTVVPGTGERFGTMICALAAQLDDTSRPADLVTTLNALLDLVG